MCRVMEEYAKEYAQEREQTLINKKIKNALDKGISPEMIVDVLDVSLEQVLEIQKEKDSE